MTKRRIALFLAAALALTLFGCASGTETAKVMPDAETQTQAQPEPRTDVENNGGHYVRVGETVYFRRYGADALPDAAIFGEFTAEWNAAAGESELMAYTPATGALDALFVESGTGPLWYGDGGFYLRERHGGEDSVVWFAADGEGRETLCPGVPLGVTESGLLAVEHTENVAPYRTTYTFYREKSAVGEASLSNEDYVSYAGLTDAGVFLVKLEFGEGTELTCRLLQLTPDGKQLDLGTLPEVENEGFYDVQADRFLGAGDTVAVGVGYYMGTGHFLGEYAFAEATVGQENSLRVMETASESEDGELPRLTTGADGTITTVAALPDELRIDWESSNLERFDGNAWGVLTADLCPRQTDGSGYRRIMQDMDYVDGRAYVTMACAFASPMDSIGWRDASALLDMLYLAVDGDGTVEELAAVDHHAELYGDVWFIEGESMALWRQLRTDTESDYIPEYAYLLPIKEDADWMGGWEAVFDGSTGLLDADYDLGEPDYYGYPLPEAEPAGPLCLTLDRDGTITRLARKAPDAMLFIEFDVPEDELADAAETIDPERRDTDEDTAWYWTKLRVLEDGVRVRVERTADDANDVVELATIEGAFIAGNVLYDGTLDRGEYLALRASLPWHPELRVSVSKDGAWGSYVFGEDNYLHMETEESVHPGLTLAAFPPESADEPDGGGIGAALTGTWLYRTPPLEYTAIVRIDEDGSVLIDDGETVWQLDAVMDQLYAQSWETPDLLCLRTSDAEAAERIGFGGAVGDYLIELFRTDDKEILHLTQANNGDGALSYLLPDAENLYDFTLTRDRGAARTGARRRSETFTAEVVRYDRERYCLWLQEAETVDEYEDGSPVLRAKTYAPCLAYPISGKDAILSLRACRDPEFPMQMFEVTVDGDGTVQLII